MKQRAFNLMKRWCDKLLEFEIHCNNPDVDGGLICPACHVIHGRAADLVYPLATIWAKTGERKYLDFAQRLVDFTERNLIRPDGSYRNDLGNSWKGTSAFSALALGETLLEFGERLPAELCHRWTTIFERLSDFTLWYFDTFTPNINYYAGAAAELALAYRLSGRREYLEKAGKWESYCRQRFDENGLLYGEIHGVDFVSERGCRGIDIGYNLEESLPLLVRYSVLTDDMQKLEFYKKRILDHLDFLLPDGAIDNSFGTRHNKWTYWGSRTSDGLLEGLAFLLDEPIFARCADKVLSLWEKCTHGELLSLPMATEYGEPSCLHHSFSHAKALATLANSPLTPARSDAQMLPTELFNGVKSYQNGNLLTYTSMGFRATFSSIDIACYRGSDNGGGSMTLLWHEKTGAICASTMETYLPSEPLNMQYLRNADSSPCMTPHLVVNGKSTVLDKSASIKSDKGVIRASGEGWSVDYSFTADSVEMAVRAKKAQLVLPIICSKDTYASLEDNRLTVGRVVVWADKQILADTSRRVFNQVGGFGYIPVTAEIADEMRVTIKVI